MESWGMSGEDPTLEYAHFHRPARFRGLELLDAHYHGYEFAPHVHEGYVIALIESGAERFYYRGAEHTAPEGTVIVVNPDEVHTGRRAAESGWSYRVFYPSLALIRDLARDMGDWTGGTPHFPETLIRDEALAGSLRSLHAALSRPAGPLEQESRWCDAMGLLLRRHGRGTGFREAGRTDAVAKARELLRERLDEPVSLAWLAAETGLSAWHLNRQFRQRYGLPPHAYQLHLRLARARLWLQSPMSVAEIAARLGFADQAHLSRLFRRAFGTSPLAYRKLA
jgi:AraC-like DNA-binding protein